MKWLFALIAAVCSFQVPASLAAEAWLSMVYTNALHAELPFSIFSKGSWSPDPNARFVKLHLYFDEPVAVQGLEIDDCGSGLDPNISLFINFDQWILSLEPELSGEIPEAIYPRRDGDLLVVEGFEESVEVRSLTINFEANSGFRVCGINLKDPNGRTYDVKTPALAGGTVGSSSILSPRSAYDPIFLFDSRFEYGWASDKKAKDVSLHFKFDRPRRVEKVRIWNGYQRSVPHCLANSRARTIRITGDGGYDFVVAVRDVLGSQVIALPKPFEGKNLKFDITDSYAGKSYKDLVISEIRFYGGGEWFMLDPARQLKSAIAANRTAFSKAGTGSLLNDSYIGEAGTEAEWISARLRLRADGSFYLSGITEDDEARQYFALGNYEIKRSDRAGGTRLRLFGLYYETEIYGDCNGCGRDCNRNESPDGVTSQKIFQEYVDIRPVKDGAFELVNESGGRKLKFKKLMLTRERPER
jgi:hypothetical protein